MAPQYNHTTIMKGTLQEVQADIFSAIGGRDDVYALQNHMGKYFPIYKPLTLEIYQDPNKTVGVYPINKAGYVNFGVFDIDILKKYLPSDNREELDELTKKQALLLQTELQSRGISSVVEFSGSKGYHVWLFLDEPVPVADMYAMLSNLKQEIGLVDKRLDVELFPKQDSVKDGGLGNLIKLPFQLHKVSKKQCHFVDDNFEPYFPEELLLNSADLIPKAPAKESQVSSVNFAKAIGPSVQPFNMDLMFDKCRILNEMQRNSDSSLFEGTPGHKKRLFLASVLDPFGSAGREKVHEILQGVPDYDVGETDKHLDSVKGPPQRCKNMCENQKCANICMAGGNSPIKFGYMDDLFVFMEKQTSSYAYLDRKDEQIYFVDSEKKLGVFLTDVNQKPKDTTPVRKVIFDPSRDLTIDKDKKTINLFKPTDYMVGEKISKGLDLSVDVPSINHLLSNLIPVSTERDRFVNWLAGIMQTRSKQLTAWVFMGQPGAGKNVLLDHVLKPLFGDKQAIKVEDEQLKNPFNGWLQNAILIAFNEVAHDNRTRNSINSKVKAIITDNDIMINEKNVKVFTIENHANALFFSNDTIPVLIEENDRRFNVVRTGGNMRKQSWFSDPEQFFADVKGELGTFAEYLINYNYDPVLAKTVISNGVKEALVDVGMTRYAEFSSHLKANDVDWFVENMDSLFPTSTIKALGLNGSIAKDSALLAFRGIYQDDRITKSKLTKELMLHGIRVGKLGGRKAYRWD